MTDTNDLPFPEQGLVLTHFLYSQSLFTALAMLGSVWGLLTALVLAHMPVGKPPLRQAGARRCSSGTAPRTPPQC